MMLPQSAVQQPELEHKQSPSQPGTPSTNPHTPPPTQPLQQVKSRLNNGGLFAQDRRDKPVSSRILLMTDPLGPMRRPTLSLGTLTEPSFWPGLPAICTVHSLCQLQSLHVSISQHSRHSRHSRSSQKAVSAHTIQPCICHHAYYVSWRRNCRRNRQ